MTPMTPVVSQDTKMSTGADENTSCARHPSADRITSSANEAELSTQTVPPTAYDPSKWKTAESLFDEDVEHCEDVNDTGMHEEVQESETLKRFKEVCGSKTYEWPPNSWQAKMRSEKKELEFELPLEEHPRWSTADLLRPWWEKAMDTIRALKTPSVKDHHDFRSRVEAASKRCDRAFAVFAHSCFHSEPAERVSCSRALKESLAELWQALETPKEHDDHHVAQAAREHVERIYIKWGEGYPFSHPK